MRNVHCFFDEIKHLMMLLEFHLRRSQDEAADGRDECECVSECVFNWTASRCSSVETQTVLILENQTDGIKDSEPIDDVTGRRVWSVELSAV